MKTTSKILQFFFHDYLEDLLALITFTKKFGFLAGVVFKIFAIENTLQSKITFCVTHLEKVIYYVTLIEQSRANTWFLK